MSVVHSPFAELSRLERLGRERGALMPTAEPSRGQWAGIAFRVGARRFVSPMQEVAEVLRPPTVSPVPHARNWLRGVANIRGTLMPVVDLSAFFGLGSAAGSALARVLVIAHGEAHTGLLVDELVGMRHFDEAAARAPTDAEYRGSGPAAAYVEAVLETDTSPWPVFSMAALARDPAFLRASA